MPTRCSPNSISTFASNQSCPLLTCILVVGLAVLNRKFFKASKPNTGIFISFIASTKRKNQLLRNTSAPRNTRLPVSGFEIKPECRLSIFAIKISSASLLRYICKILSPSGIINTSLSPAFVSNPLYENTG